MPDDAPSIEQTADALVPVLYGELRRMARGMRWRVSAGHTVQTTALVHEAFLKLRGSAGFNDRQHFMRSAAVAMRHILVNLARDACADKRGGGAQAVSLDDAPEVAAEDASHLLDIDRALRKLRNVDPRLADLVECRYFGGYGDAEISQILGLSERSLRRDWLKARAWLQLEMGVDPAGLPPQAEA